MDKPISIAIETSCRNGGLALGAGQELLETVQFQADQRHAVQLVPRLDELLRAHGLESYQIGQVYVSIGPGSFTGLRVGITVARTMAQAVAGLKLVAVPTIEAVAQNALELPTDRVAVAMDAKEQTLYAGLFRRGPTGSFELENPARLVAAQDLPNMLPDQMMLIGEALWYQKIQGVELGPEDLYLPRPRGVWQVGRRMAKDGQFQDLHKLLPLYLRQPEAIRLWEKQGKP